MSYLEYLETKNMLVRLLRSTRTNWRNEAYVASLRELETYVKLPRSLELVHPSTAHAWQHSSNQVMALAVDAGMKSSMLP